MVYRRRTFKRKRMFRKSRKGIATKSYVRKIIRANIELKRLNMSGTGSAIGRTITNSGAGDFTSVSYGSTAVAAGLCASILSGTGAGARIGLKIRLKGVYVNLAIQPGDDTNYIRFLLVSPKPGANKIDYSSTSAFVQQCLSDYGSAASQVIAPVDTDLFKVHFDKKYYMRFVPKDGNSGTTLASNRFLKKFIRFNRTIWWDESNSGLPTSDVFLVATSDSAAVGNPGTQMANVDVFYTDS